MKVSVRNIFLFFGIALLALIPLFESQLILIFPTGVNTILILQILAVCFLVLGVARGGKIRLQKTFPQYMNLWILMIPFFVYGMLHNEKSVTFRIVFCIAVCILLTTQTDWIKYLKGFLLIFSFISVFFTLYFYVFPGQYAAVRDFYGYFPPGTGKLTTGYRAGISAHYSHNGISIALYIMTAVCMILSCGTQRKEKHRRFVYAILVLLGAVAALLNAKRGTLVWCICAVVFTYFASSRKKLSRFGKLLFMGINALLVLQVLSETVPQVEYLFNRFAAIGEDAGSWERLAMWDLALQNFMKAPLFGIGFMNYRGEYTNSLFTLYGTNTIDESYQRLDAHNVYLQVLCEMGIVGMILYISALVFALLSTHRLIRYYMHSNDRNLRFAALFSFCIQLYYMMYSLTGNCLYDINFYFYAFAIAMTASLSHLKRRNDSTQ